MFMITLGLFAFVQDISERSVPIEVELVVAVRDDASLAWLKELKKKFEVAVEKWWRCTEGNMAFTSIKIIDRCETGDVMVANLDSAYCRDGVYGETKGTKIYLGGRFPTVTFCHEMGHRWFGLPDEYNKPKCGNCVMEPWKGLFEFCDEDNHTSRGADCWSRILKVYPEWERRVRFGACPAVKISITNR